MGSRRYPAASDRLKLGIIFGGRGPEHEASLLSARAVMDGLHRRHYQVEQFGIAKSGEWLVGPSAWAELLRAADPDLLPGTISGQRNACHNGMERAEVLPAPDVLRYLVALDCIFPLVHGVGGEDGNLQGLLSYTGKPIVGSPVLATAQGYNKWTAKQLAIAAGVPVAKGTTVDRQDGRSQSHAKVYAKFGHWDLFVKPVSCGSSFGVSRIRSEAEFDRALEAAFAYSRDALVEEYIEHTEIFVGVLEEKERLLIASPASEKPGQLGFSTYGDKYIKVEDSLKCPSVLGRKLEREVRSLAGKVFKALGCAGFARVDFFLSSRERRLVFNEINTIPAMACDCAFPTGMQKTGMTYPQLLDKMIWYAIEGEPAKRAMPVSTPLLPQHDDADRSHSDTIVGL